MSQDRLRRIGVFGGTFDPVHNGHIEVARFAAQAASLDLVLMIPARDPWLRAESPGAPPEDRARMVELAIDGIEALEMSRVDLDRVGETYTADTLSDLRDAYGPETQLVLVLGADSAASMDRWKRADELSAMCEILVIGRPDREWPQKLPAGHPAANATYVEGPMIDISATEIRRRITSGETLRGILPEQVERHITEHGLYGAGGDRRRE